MPISVPRVSVTEAADDLKARDAMLRQFPEVEQVVGKAGRAETPTDPAPLDMIETVVNLRPKEFWPKRHLRYADAMAQTAVVLHALEARQADPSPDESRRPAGFDQRRRDGRHGQARRGPAAVDPRSGTQNSSRRLERQLTHDFIARLGRYMATAPVSYCSQSTTPGSIALAETFRRQFGPWLAAGAAQEDVNRLIRQIAESLDRAEGRRPADSRRCWTCRAARSATCLPELREQLGVEPQTLFTSMREFTLERRDASLERRWPRSWTMKCSIRRSERSIGSASKSCVNCAGGTRGRHDRHRGNPRHPRYALRANVPAAATRRIAVTAARTWTSVLSAACCLAEIEGRPGQGNG